jgi:hypothetical protein
VIGFTRNASYSASGSVAGAPHWLILGSQRIERMNDSAGRFLKSAALSTAP